MVGAFYFVRDAAPTTRLHTGLVNLPEEESMTGRNTSNKLRRLVWLAAWAAVFVVFAPQADADHYNRETPVVKAVRAVSPAVVNISSQIQVRQAQNPFSGMAPPHLEWFFRDFFDPGWERRYRTTSLGSGVIIDGERGFILTNAHVVARAGAITVTLMDERQFDAQLVGSDPDSDLAVLRIDADQPLPAVAMGRCDDLMIGETVIAIGNPFGFSHTVTTGVISAVNRSFRADDREYYDFIQIDASINPGNSGGPLLNINGELIGINTAIYAKAQGIGFAIPIDRAQRIVNDLINFGEVIQAWIGLRVQDLDHRLATYLGLADSNGVLVRAVEGDSPAEKAGILSGDVILSVDGNRIADTEAYRRAAAATAPRRPLSIELWREGRVLKKTVQTSVYPPEKAARLAQDLFGITVADITPALRKRYRLAVSSGVVITAVAPDTFLAQTGVEPGDVIRQVGDEPVKDRQDFEKALVKQRLQNAVVLLVQRGRQGYYITVELY
jgi:Do/DeqQ family serine protease